MKHAKHIKRGFKRFHTKKCWCGDKFVKGNVNVRNLTCKCANCMGEMRMDELVSMGFI